jgi:hypothetical protein
MISQSNSIQPELNHLIIDKTSDNVNQMTEHFFNSFKNLKSLPCALIIFNTEKRTTNE